FGAVNELIDLFHANAASDRNTASVLAMLWMQGEANYAGTGTPIKDQYRARLTTLLDRFRTKVGQSSVPAFLTYAASTNNIRARNFSIAMAQIEFALETPGVWCFGPAYPYPRYYYSVVQGAPPKDGISANGARWMGAQAAKILARVAIERLDWEPLFPLWIEARGRTIYVGFHVPVGRLQFQPVAGPIDARDFDPSIPIRTPMVMARDNGFAVRDANGTVPISTTRLLGSTIVALDCERDIASDVFVEYCSQDSHWLGNLCDTDTATSTDLIIPTGLSLPEGQLPGAGAPYPLLNWCTPFRLPVGYSRT
ncbi:MAG: hypothetical protein EOO81_12330, partial [Oxalobacteraceae bacterium]